MTIRQHIRPLVSVRSAFELTVLAALPMIPWAAKDTDVVNLADRTGRTPQEVLEDAISGDTIAWTVDGIWVCLGAAGDNYGATPRPSPLPLLLAA
jgi:hypothetical protein